LKFGVLMVCAENQMDVDKLVKNAQWYNIPATMLKVVAGLALVTGVPIGIAAHVIDRHINSERQKERELQEKIKYYQNAVGGIQTGLQAGTATGQESQAQL